MKGGGEEESIDDNAILSRGPVCTQKAEVKIKFLYFNSGRCCMRCQVFKHFILKEIVSRKF
jgi:hypothetical protein